MKKVATFMSGRNEIWDYRNLSIMSRIRIAYDLIFTGVVEIEWKEVRTTLI